MSALRIKICGLTHSEDVRAAVRFGADALGFNFHPGSVRYVDPKHSAKLLQVVPPLTTVVGVFVGLPMRQVSAMAYQMGIRAVQWVGDNPEVADSFPFSRIMAFRVGEKKHLNDIQDYLARCRTFGTLPGAILIDAFVAGEFGGTGQRAPWNLLADFACEVPLILAGGLTPENVAEAIRIVRPAGVDVASGVEFQPGRKDADKMQRFIENAREVL